MQIGVREIPSSEDYIRFLGELALECGDRPLNPNELRATGAIIHVIFHFCGFFVLFICISTNFQAILSSAEYSDMSSRPGQKQPVVYVPDENGSLRDARQVLVS